MCKETILQISDETNGDQLRSYILNIMKSIQEVRNLTGNLGKNGVIYEMYNERLSEANAVLCGLNDLMGDIIGYTVADDIWERQTVTL